MSTTLWTTLVFVAAGFLFGKLIYNFVGFIAQSIKDSEENDR